MIAMLGGWLAKSALMTSPIGKFVKLVPKQVWIALAVAAALFFAYKWHQHKAETMRRTAYTAGYKKAIEDDRAEALKLEARINALTRQIAEDERKRNDEAAARINTHADALSVRGPGKSACTRLPGAATAASRPVAPTGLASAPAIGLPAEGGLAGVPWPWLVSTGRTCDLNREENVSWRSWYGKLEKAWPKPQH